MTTESITTPDAPQAQGIGDAPASDGASRYSIKALSRTLTLCAEAMERGRRVFFIPCEPIHICAVRRYLADSWGQAGARVCCKLEIRVNPNAMKRKGAER